MSHEVYIDKKRYVEATEEPPVDEPPRFNSAAFYNFIRANLFGGSLNQGQVDGHNILGQACVAGGLSMLVEHTAYVLATAYHETAQTMQPIEEYYGSNASYAPWYGRGYVQLTWEENYQKQQDKLGHLGEDYKVHADWNRALIPAVSAAITVGGMQDGDFTGMELDDYIKPGSVDYVNARRIVNGTDRAEQIAEYARKYETAIRAGMYV